MMQQAEFTPRGGGGFQVRNQEKLSRLSETQKLITEFLFPHMLNYSQTFILVQLSLLEMKGGSDLVLVPPAEAETVPVGRGLSNSNV